MHAAVWRRLYRCLPTLPLYMEYGVVRCFFLEVQDGTSGVEKNPAVVGLCFVLAFTAVMYLQKVGFLDGGRAGSLLRSSGADHGGQQGNHLLSGLQTSNKKRTNNPSENKHKNKHTTYIS